MGRNVKTGMACQSIATTEEQTLLYGWGIFLKNWHGAVLFAESNNTWQQETGRPIPELDPRWAVEYVCPWEIREDKSWPKSHSDLPLWSPGTGLSLAFCLFSKRSAELETLQRNTTLLNLSSCFSWHHWQGVWGTCSQLGSIWPAFPMF